MLFSGAAGTTSRSRLFHARPPSSTNSKSGQTTGPAQQPTCQTTGTLAPTAPYGARSRACGRPAPCSSPLRSIPKMANGSVRLRSREIASFASRSRHLHRNRVICVEIASFASKSRHLRRNRGICVEIAAFASKSRHLHRNRGICAEIAAFAPKSRHLHRNRGICAEIAAKKNFRDESPGAAALARNFCK